MNNISRISIVNTQEEVSKASCLRMKSFIAGLLESENKQLAIKKVIVVNNGKESNRLYYLQNQKILYFCLAQQDFNNTGIKYLYQNSSVIDIDSPLCLSDAGKKNLTANDSFKVLFFKNIMNARGKKVSSIHPATWFLASAVSGRGNQILFSDSKISLNPDDIFITQKEALDNLLTDNKDINLICLSLCEDYFKQARQLIRYLRKNSRAFLAIGGVMPTQSPEAVFLNIPEANFIVRGEGEGVLRSLAKILRGKYYNEELASSQIALLMEQRGLLFHNSKIFVSAVVDKINFMEPFNKYGLDFSLLGKTDLQQGVPFFSSRGCKNNCCFCSTIGKGYFRGLSFSRLKHLLSQYQNYLISIYGALENIPYAARGLAFYDDDFLADRKRAQRFFNFMQYSFFFVSFLQVSVNSFFKKSNKGERKLDNALLQSIDPGVFTNDTNKKENSEKINFFIGSENFCNRELKNLSKGYDFSDLLKLIDALSRHKIYQAHHLIFSNIYTDLNAVMENIIKVVWLRAKYAPYFDILTPVIPRLVSLASTVNYQIVKKRGDLGNIAVSSKLRVEKLPQYNYDIVDHDNAKDKDVRELADNINFFFKKPYLKALENVLFILLYKKESLAIKGEKLKRLQKLQSVIDNNYNYKQKILSKLPKNKGKNIFAKKVANIQLMVTRRCFLRCKYCPVQKRNQDMSLVTLKKSIELLFTSPRKKIRLDFTGGEPLKRFDLIKKAINYAERLKREKHKQVNYYVITNGIALTKEVVDFLSQVETKIEISFDGTEEIHNKYKISGEEGIENPYRQACRNLHNLFDSDLDHTAVMVVSPEDVGLLADNFNHLIKLGFSNIEINYAIGKYWCREKRQVFREQFKKINDQHYQHLAKRKLIWGNIRGRLEPAILNAELMVDVDGSIHLLSEFQFDQDLATAGAPFNFGDISQIKDISQLYYNRFYNYYTINKMYAQNNKELRKIIHNNIIMGVEVKKLIKKLKEKY
jgi:sulfatase maturation enzyme AslB (radical SAM superfamily)